MRPSNVLLPLPLGSLQKHALTGSNKQALEGERGFPARPRELNSRDIDRRRMHGSYVIEGRCVHGHS